MITKTNKNGHIVPELYYSDQENYETIGNNVERIVLNVLSEVNKKPLKKKISILTKVIECLNLNLDKTIKNSDLP